MSRRRLWPKVATAAIVAAAACLILTRAEQPAAKASPREGTLQRKVIQVAQNCGLVSMSKEEIAAVRFTNESLVVAGYRTEHFDTVIADACSASLREKMAEIGAEERPRGMGQPVVSNSKVLSYSLPDGDELEILTMLIEQVTTGNGDVQRRLTVTASRFRPD